MTDLIESTHRTTRRRVLLVEDEEDHQVHFEATLNLVAASERPALQCASSLAEADARLTADPYDVVFLDLGLSDSRGMDSLRRLTHAHPAVPIVVLTASSDPVLGVEAVRAGAQDFLQKGRLDRETLMRALQYAIERRRVLADLERKQQALRAFVHSASHDMRAPLRRIEQWIGFLESEGTAGFNEEQRDCLDRVASQAHVMQELVTKLLELGSVGVAQVESAECDLAEPLADALEALGDAVSTHVTSSSMPPVLGDRRLLASVFQNLCENAVKYVRGRAPSVEVRAVQREGWVDVTVEDNGIGLTPEQAERVFEPFVRCAPGAEFAGTGIGLATCRTIVEAHGGHIGVDSEVGVGSRFRFTLPAARPAE